VEHRLSDVLNHLLREQPGRELDIATADFSIQQIASQEMKERSTHDNLEPMVGKPGPSSDNVNRCSS
jgi:hypothetical protein